MVKKMSLIALMSLVLFGVFVVGSISCAAPSSDLTITSSTDSNHSHQVTIKGADIDNPLDKTYTSTATGATPHTHTVTITKAQFQDTKQGKEVIITSSPAGANNHTHTFTIKK